ncbi:MAG: hypothetical protein K0S58_900 [Nitrospira sp.]|jgi:hypothetical protein|nr:hypothetical protein [Nitrospira sp.]
MRSSVILAVQRQLHVQESPFLDPRPHAAEEER